MREFVNLHMRADVRTRVQDECIKWAKFDRYGNVRGIRAGGRAAITGFYMGASEYTYTCAYLDGSQVEPQHRGVFARGYADGQAWAREQGVRRASRTERLAAQGYRYA